MLNLYLVSVLSELEEVGSGKTSRKKKIRRLVCEGPVEPSDTNSSHSSTLKHTTTTTLDFKMMDMVKVKVNSHKDGGWAALKPRLGRGCTGERMGKKKDKKETNEERE